MEKNIIRYEISKVSVRTCDSCSVVASVASLARPSSYLSRAVSLSSKFCSNAETSCLAAASTAATFCVMDLTWPITLSSRKSYGNVSVHSASSCTSRGTKRCRRSWNTPDSFHMVPISPLFTSSLPISSTLPNKFRIRRGNWYLKEGTKRIVAGRFAAYSLFFCKRT